MTVLEPDDVALVALSECDTSARGCGVATGAAVSAACELDAGASIARSVCSCVTVEPECSGGRSDRTAGPRLPLRTAGARPGGGAAGSRCATIGLATGAITGARG